MRDSVRVVRVVVSRLLGGVLTVVGVMVVAFVGLRLLAPQAFPDPRPLPQELWSYLKRALLHGDLGRSENFRTGFQPVTEMITEGIAADVSLFAGALVFGVAAGVAGGVACARRPRGPLDRALLGLAILAISAPVYWIGLMLVLLLGRNTGTLAELPFVTANTYEPLTAAPGEWLRSLAVPWCVAGAPLAAFVLRLTRGSLLETEQQEYVRLARAKGLGERRVVFRHALPPALAPTIALVGAYAPLLVGNAILVELVFGIPGAFSTFPQALNTGDFPLIQGLVAAGAVLVVLGNLVADVVLARLDARIR